MKITRHPASENLMSCSAGSQPEAFAAVMSSHLAMCPECREHLALMELVGTALFERIEAAPLTREAPVMALHAREADVDTDEPSDPYHTTAGGVPAPLVAAIGSRLDAVRWKRVAPGVWQHHIKLSRKDRGELRLIKVAPGMALPEHSHTGNELTLVLDGSYTDSSGTYRVGDVADMDGDACHAPTADASSGCICLIATQGRLKFKSTLARLFQPLSGF